MKIRCSACRQKYQVPDNYVGKRVRCTQCATVFVAAEDVPAVEDVSFWRGAMADVAKRYGNGAEPAEQNPATVREE